MQITYTKPPHECLQAAQNGETLAQLEMGLRCLSGDGIEKSLQSATEWFEKAATKGNADAQWHLGMLCFGAMGAKRDPARAVQWLKKAADQGHAEAGGRLGLAYLSGDGVSADETLGLLYLQLAEGVGNPVYDYLLAEAYIGGKFGKRDLGKATSLLTRAARAGMTQAQAMLAAVIYWDGKIGPEERIASLAWATLAASRGAQKAEVIRDQLEREMDPGAIEQARNRARKWHKEIPALPNSFA